MFMGVDRLITELPLPQLQDPNAGAALQEPVGGKYGEMSTFGTYMFESFNCRSKSKLRPFDSLMASIAAAELAHVELVGNGIPMLNNGPTSRAPMRGRGAIARARRMRQCAISVRRQAFCRMAAAPRR